MKEKDNKMDIINKAGIFAGSFLVTAMAVYFYSPVLLSNANETTSTLNVSVRNREVVSIALDKNNLSFSLDPTEAGSFSSGSVTATVNTNSLAGYELYFSSVDDATDMAHVASSVSDVISSDFSGTVTSSTMAKNKWGYSLDNTDFSKIPTATEQARLKDLDHLPTTAEKSTDVYVGVKVGADLKSGKYSKSVKFSAIAHEVPITIFSITQMQEMTPTICANTTKPSASATTNFDWDGSHHGDTSYVPRTVLTDSRDGNEYLVSKLADGKCWMSQNLALDLTENVPVEASTVDGGTTTYIPSMSTVNDTNTPWGYATNDPSPLHTRSYKAQPNEAYLQGGTVKSSVPTDTTRDYYWEKTGNFYNWLTATAGSGSDKTPKETNVNASLCPRGWKLPSTTEGDFRILGNTYGITSQDMGTALLQSPLNFIKSGTHSYGNGSSGAILSGVGEESQFWTRTANARSIWLLSNGKGMWSNLVTVEAGFSIRCVAI